MDSFHALRLSIAQFPNDHFSSRRGELTNCADVLRVAVPYDGGTSVVLSILKCSTSLLIRNRLRCRGHDRERVAETFAAESSAYKPFVTAGRNAQSFAMECVLVHTHLDHMIRVGDERL